MKRPKYHNDYALDILFVLAILVMFFVYYVVYRTESREAWNLESFRQFELLINTVRDILLSK